MYTLEFSKENSKFTNSDEINKIGGIDSHLWLRTKIDNKVNYFEKYIVYNLKNERHPQDVNIRSCGCGNFPVDKDGMVLCGPKQCGELKDYYIHFKNSKRPIYSNMLNHKSLFSKIKIIVFSPYPNSLYQPLWINRAINASIDVFGIFNERDLFQIINNFQSRNNWFLLVSNKTYIFVGNMLELIKSRNNDIENCYLGFSFISNEIIYNSIDAGILFKFGNDFNSFEFTSVLEKNPIDVALGKYFKMKGVEPEQVLGFEALSPLDTLNALDKGEFPRNFYSSPPSTELLYPPLSFGNCESMKKMDFMETLQPIPKVVFQLFSGDLNHFRTYEDVSNTCRYVYEKDPNWVYRFTHFDEEEKLTWFNNFKTRSNPLYSEKLCVTHVLNRMKNEEKSKVNIERFGGTAITRLEILFRYGGYYYDNDIICLKPIDLLGEYFYENNLNLMTSCATSILFSDPKTGFRYNNCFFGSPPYSLTLYLILKAQIDQSKKLLNISNGYKRFGVPLYNVMYHLLETPLYVLIHEVFGGKTREMRSRSTKKEFLDYLETTINSTPIFGIHLFGDVYEQFKTEINEIINTIVIRE